MEDLEEEIRKFCYDKKFSAMFVDGLVPILREFYLKQTNKMIGTLYKEIRHGDDEHQAWLFTKMKDFYEQYYHQKQSVPKP